MPKARTLSPQDLIAADYSLVLPLRVDLGGGQPAIIECCKCLRMLPGCRLVLEGQWQQQRVVLKLFFRRKDFQREKRGHRQLNEAGLWTPELLLSWSTEQRASPAVDVLIYRFVKGSSLMALWQGEKELRARALHFTRAVAVIAQMHQAGLQQKDIHLDNFLVSNGRLCILDAGTVSRGAAPLESEKAHQNLAWLLAQVPSINDRHIDEIFNGYVRGLSAKSQAPDFSASQLRKTVTQLRTKRWWRYQQKLTRSCTEFVVDKCWNRFQVIRRDSDNPALRELLADIDGAMALGVCLKDGKTATVTKVKTGDRSLVIKRYNIKNWKHGLGRLLRSSQAWDSWCSAYHLRFEGLLTPLPIALVEERIGPGRRRAYFITDYAQGPNLLSAMSGNGAMPLSEQALDDTVVDTFTGLLAARLSHGNMQATHFIVTSQGLSTIDLDTMNFYVSKQKHKKALRRDFEQFMGNYPSEQKTHFKRVLQPVYQLLDTSLGRGTSDEE
ncbi:MAG: hypothetical protein V3T17_13450 [Pseudomonadales bacterium]